MTKPRGNAMPAIDFPSDKQRVKDFGKSDAFARASIKAVCREFGVTYEDLMSASRQRYLVVLRYLICYVLRPYGHNTVTMARALGRDHSTVAAGVIRWTPLFQSEECMETVLRARRVVYSTFNTLFPH